TFGDFGYPFTNTIGGNTPDRFRDALRKTKERLLARTDGPRVLNINCWNEWTEGSYLEPDVVNGMKYLEAVRDGFGAKRWGGSGRRSAAEARHGCVTRSRRHGGIALLDRGIEELPAERARVADPSQRIHDPGERDHAGPGRDPVRIDEQLARHRLGHVV